MTAAFDKDTETSIISAVATRELQCEHRIMVANLLKSGEDILDSLTPRGCDQLHAVIGIAGEAGELLDGIKKATIYRKPINIENITEELGDLEFYIEALRQCTGITREETLKHNLNKLLKGDKARYKKGTYSDQAAVERQDKAE